MIYFDTLVPKYILVFASSSVISIMERPGAAVTIRAG